ncbi:hypothetical protein HF521_019742 [Silurus meridionalis]|uniref:Netrin-1-like n=1 Tax=Silurus meridionalis TaxID=175797 RepID=A0A8T0BHD0_SILME|nr:hypothetical protein HF521_019742 [Silurus meridionalis]
MLQYHSPTSLALSFLLSLFLSFLPYSFLSSLSQSPLRWSSPHDPCYHLDGRARHCLSDFINAAYGMPVRAEDLQQGTERNISTLTDLHNPHNLTCWKASEGSVNGDWTFTIPLGRRFEVTYISLQFCQQVEPTDPFSISILKSMDYGRSWRPLQFYSSDCMGRFGLPAQSVALSRHQETESLCSDPRPLQKHRGGVVLAFSTLDGRPSSSDFEYSPGLQDWVTATDIRIVFHQSQGKSVRQDKKPDEVGEDLKWSVRSNDEVTQSEKQREANAWIKMTETRRHKKGEKSSRRNRNKSSSQETGHNVTRKQSEIQEGRGKRRGQKKDTPQWKPCQNGLCDWMIEIQGQSTKRNELRKRRNNAGRAGSRSRLRKKVAHHLLPSSLSAPPTHTFALADVQVGGRCKCNGHASRCRRDDRGNAHCQCEHHTAGPDCDACEPFYYDRPWQRATPTQPHPCVPCQCNGHSNKCRFSMTVFQQSGRVSGGVCLKCRHHTTGRHCELCQNGYTRDHSKPLDHRKACQSCQCHPLGAVGHWCNQSTGQCLCREGVTGQRCNRCAPGYKHGHSPIRPCIRIPEAVPPTPVYQPQYSIAEECLSYCQPSQAKVKMNLETFCLKDYVKKGLQTLWVPDRDVSCGCPTLQVGRTFLLIGAEENRRGWDPGERRLVADRSTMALQWREHWNPKLRGFRGHDNRGKCLPNTNSTTRTHSLLQTQEAYIPPHLKKLQPERLHFHHQLSAKSDEIFHTHSPNTTLDTQKDSTNTQDLQGQLVHNRDNFENGDNPKTQYPKSDARAETSPTIEPQQQETSLLTSSPVTDGKKEESSTEPESAH